jgi:ribosomal-protein-alanine N-acetyltransferase
MKRQGIGNELLNKVETIANKFGIKEIFLEVRESNKEAISFYKNNKFTEIGLRKNYYKLYSGREDALIFSKKLRNDFFSLKQIFYILGNILRLRIR